jgi:hypothetical protein
LKVYFIEAPDGSGALSRSWRRRFYDASDADGAPWNKRGQAIHSSCRTIIVQLTIQPDGAGFRATISKREDQENTPVELLRSI